MKRIWIINQYNMPPEYGHLNRHYYFGKYLKRLGEEPSVFVGSFLHNINIQMINDENICRKYEKSEYPYYFIKTCNYSKSTIKRVYAMFEFYVNLLKATKNMEKPDVIIGSSAHPLAAIAAIRLAKKYGCQSIVEVRDLWPESFVAYGIIGKRNPLLRLLYAGEKWIYKKADKLIFTMEGGKDYIVERGWDKASGGPIDISKVYHINNGVDLDAFDYNRRQYQIDDPDLKDANAFNVVYTGSIRRVNQVGLILDVAKIFKKKNIEDIRFLIWGDGDEKEKLQKRAKDEHLNNVCFKGHVDKKYIPYITSQSQLNIALAKNNPLYRFGGSLNKMFEYFAAGKPILFTFQLGYSIIERYSTGIEMSDSSPTKIAETILYFKSLSAVDYESYSRNARRAALEYDFKALTDKLIDVIYRIR